MTRRTSTAAALGVWAAIAPGALGQDGADADQGAVEAPERSPIHLTLNSSVLYTTAADFDDAGGEVSVLRAGGRAGVGFSTSPTSQVRVSFGTEHSFYEFDGPVTLAPGTNEPWEDVHSYDVSAQFNARASDSWSWFVGGSVESSAETGADFGDSLTYGGFGGVRYHVSPSLQIGAALIVSSRLEDDARVLVLPSVEWTIDEHWSLGSWNLGTRSGGYALRYRPSEELTLGVGATYMPREFRLDEDGPVPDGVGRDDRVPVHVFAVWSPEPTFSLRADIGADVYGHLEVLDAAGNKLGEDETNPAFTFGLSATLRF